VFSNPSVASSIFSGKPFIFRLISSLSSSTLFSVPAFPEQAFNPRGIHVGGKLPLPGLPKDGEHLLYQSPTLIRRQVPGVDGLLFGLKPAELGQVPVDDSPYSSIDLLAREPSPQINLLHMGTVTSSQALPSARLRRSGGKRRYARIRMKGVVACSIETP
jgi:hypothetical protein